VSGASDGVPVLTYLSNVRDLLTSQRNGKSSGTDFASGVDEGLRLALTQLDWMIEHYAKAPDGRAASYLSPPEMFRLDLACRPLRQAFPEFGPYLVGSVSRRRDFRDVDVRCVLKDKRYDQLAKAVGINGITFLGLAVSAYLRDATGLPIDFQFQRATEAQKAHEGFRNPLGVRGLGSFRGDATPTPPQADTG